jgi:hypothetical protein
MTNMGMLSDDTTTEQLLHDMYFVIEAVSQAMQRMNRKGRTAQYSSYWLAAELVNYALELMRRFAPEELKELKEQNLPELTV